VESTSQSKLVLTPRGRSVHQLGIASDGDWPSWLHVLSLFLDGGSDVSKVMVVAPSKYMVNVFGLNQASDTVAWHKLNLSKAIHTSSRHKLMLNLQELAVLVPLVASVGMMETNWISV
jgi:hypothetical protein